MSIKWIVADRKNWHYVGNCVMHTKKPHLILNSYCDSTISARKAKKKIEPEYPQNISLEPKANNSNAGNEFRWFRPGCSMYHWPYGLCLNICSKTGARHRHTTRERGRENRKIVKRYPFYCQKYKIFNSANVYAMPPSTANNKLASPEHLLPHMPVK